MDLINKILLTIVAVGCGILPIMVDFSETHLLNENWSSHARTHVAWLLATNFLTSMLSLYFLWAKNLKHIPILFISSIIAGYFISILTKDSYGGSISEIGGVEDNIYGIEAGIFFFSSLLIILVLTIISITLTEKIQQNSIYNK